MQFCGISFMQPYKESGRWQDVLDIASDQTAYTDARKKCHKTACISLLEDEHLDGRNMSKTL
jgi:hypothetical protein